jgi:cytochrome P450
MACREALRALSEDSRRTTDGVRPREYIGGWVLAALARLLFGMEPGDPRIGALDRAQRDLRLDRMGGPRWRRQLEEAFVSATAVLRDKARESAASGALDGTALGALLGADPEAMENETRARNLFFIFRLGLTDATALLDWVMTKLGESPEWQTKVRAVPRTWGAPHGSQPPDCASRVVLETLRMEQSEFMYRRIVRPIVVERYSIPAGWLLRNCVQEGHRDPDIFPDPDRFDPDRFTGRVFGRAEYSPFGADNHGCLGRHLVQFLGRIFVEELCHGYEWRVTRDGPLERGSRHRHHWRPSALRRVVMTPLGAEHAAQALRAGGALGNVV